MATRKGLRVRGTVQGVGFRPMVFRLASAHGLAGFVRNDAQGVWIEVEGANEAVDRFAERLRAEAPPLSRIASVEVAPLAPKGELEFQVVGSARGPGTSAAIPADAATCERCLVELFDPDDRRFRYPFVNCTDCGPRYSIVRDVPYDRARTTMCVFPLCDACRAEYEDPRSRRFHAEPNACPRCGPRLEYRGPGGAALGELALQRTLEDLARGRIVAVKGLGGFFLAVDAANDVAVKRLRERKRRPHKPFALMARDLGQVDRIARFDPIARDALVSPVRPIVLVPRRPDGPIAPSVAPGLSEVGVMLPYTPLHHLLCEKLPLLVMTSGNVSEEPIAKGNDEALSRLAEVADAFLLNDREIHARVDDSVLRVMAGRARPVRRARGFVPDAIPLGFEAPEVLAVGPALKNTLCFTRGDRAYLSPHVGDLESPSTFSFFTELISTFSELLAVRPRVVAHDLHPDYPSTRWALASGLPRERVQHHHAHIASCLAEHGRTEKVLGIAFDGTGCGPEGDAWGGEILLADLAGFRRLGHLRPIALAGGPRAIRQPWRLALAALLDAGEGLEGMARIPAEDRDAVRRMLERGVGSPLATGAGRWFDAVASLCAVRDEISYEGQAAVELEARVSAGAAEAYPFELTSFVERPWQVDLRPTVRAIAADLRAGISAAVVAARFHETLCSAVLEGCVCERDARGIAVAALSGGCFQNRRLTERMGALLEQSGFEVLVHRTVPPNDGGVALGQAAVAAYRWRAREEA